MKVRRGMSSCRIVNEVAFRKADGVLFCIALSFRSAIVIWFVKKWRHEDLIFLSQMD